MKLALFLLPAVIAAADLFAQGRHQRTYANPIDRALTAGQAYWVAIESFDESGVSTLSSPVPIQ